MFDRLIFAFYKVDSIENWVLFFILLRIEIEHVRFFCNLVLWRYQMIIMIRKHGVVSRSQCKFRKRIRKIWKHFSGSFEKY